MSEAAHDTVSHQDFEITLAIPLPIGEIDVAPRKPAAGSLQGKPSQWAVDLAYLAKHFGKWVLVGLVFVYGGYRGVAWSGDHVVDPLVAASVAKDQALAAALDRNERLTTALEAAQKLMVSIQSDLSKLKQQSQ